ncbi:MAG: copper resistance CopC family protein, partial [Rubrobacter sp.]
MKAAPSTRRLTLVLGLSTALALALVYRAPALAHANLVGSSPPAGSETSTSPGRVELRFSEPVDAAFDPLVVRDAEGDRVDRGDARVDPGDARVVLATLEELTAGSYSVEWRVTSIDGHVIEGRYGFDVTGSDRAADDEQGAAATGAEGPSAGERAGRAEREPAARGGGPGDSPGGPPSIL